MAAASAMVVRYVAPRDSGGASFYEETTFNDQHFYEF